jgi:AbiJ N-terminal domain 4
MKSFSQRKGLKSVSEILQIESMSDELKNSLWNVLHTHIWSDPEFFETISHRISIYMFSRILWENYFKRPLDTISNRPNVVFDEIRTYYFLAKWNEVYDFLEFVVSLYQNLPLANGINFVLDRELSGYKLISGFLVDITSEEETKMIEEGMRDTQFSGVSAHIQRALELYANREKPDYRNSIKESISAVESMARILAGTPSVTLGDALKIIEKNGKLHKALKDGFLKLYGYTSDEQGIRHAMLDEPDLTAADARYFLVSCSAFVNYLKAQLS